GGDRKAQAGRPLHSVGRAEYVPGAQAGRLRARDEQGPGGLFRASGRLGGQRRDQIAVPRHLMRISHVGRADLSLAASFAAASAARTPLPGWGHCQSQAATRARAAAARVSCSEGPPAFAMWSRTQALTSSAWVMGPM